MKLRESRRKRKIKRIINDLRDKEEELELRGEICILTNSMRTIVQSFPDYQIAEMVGTTEKIRKKTELFNESWGFLGRLKTKMEVRVSRIKDRDPLIDQEEAIDRMNQHHIMDVPLEKLTLRFKNKDIIKVIERKFKEAGYAQKLPKDDFIYLFFERRVPENTNIREKIKKKDKYLRKKWIETTDLTKEDTSGRRKRSGLFFQGLLPEILMMNLKNREVAQFRNLEFWKRLQPHLRQYLGDNLDQKRDHLHHMCAIVGYGLTEEEGWTVNKVSLF